MTAKNGRQPHGESIRREILHAETRVNLALLLAIWAATLFALLAVPIGLLSHSAAWALLLLPIALMTTTLWALAHEAMHGNFHPNRRLNDTAGRSLAVLIGSSFRLLRFAHLMHHRFNRYHLDRPDICNAGGKGRLSTRAAYLLQLLFGHYLLEVAVPLFCLLPRPAVQRGLAHVYASRDPVVETVRDIANNALLSPRGLREIREDALGSALLMALAGAAYGSHWPLLMAFIAGRGVLLSFFSNLYHFATPVERPDFAWNLSLPAPLRVAILNMNLHQLHHDQPELSWSKLAERFRELDCSFDAGFAAVAFRQLSGPCTPEECRRALASSNR